MMNRSIIVMTFIMAAFVWGCAKSSYIGKTYTPTANVEMYTNATSITRQYEIMGQISIDEESLVSADKLQEATGVTLDTFRMINGLPVFEFNP